MKTSRRAIIRTMRAEATRSSPEPDDAFIARLERRLLALDVDAAPTTPSNVVALRRRLTRGAAIGVIAGVMTAAGAAAVAIVTVRHISEPAPHTTPTTSTQVPAGSPHTIPSTAVSPSSTVEPATTTTTMPATTTTPVLETAPTSAPSTTTAATTASTVTAIGQISALGSTIPPSTAPSTGPVAPPAIVPTATAPSTIPTATATATATTAPTEPPPPTTPPPTVPPPTAAPTTTEVHVAAAMQLGCSAGAGAVSCSWSAVPDGTDHVVVLRSTPGESRGRVLSPGAGATSIVDSTATPGVTYTYLVHALDAAGHSLAHSNAVTVACCG